MASGMEMRDLGFDVATEFRRGIVSLAVQAPRMAKKTLEQISFEKGITYLFDPPPAALPSLLPSIVKARRLFLDYGDIPPAYWGMFKPKSYDPLFRFSFKSIVSASEGLIPRGHMLAKITGDLVEGAGNKVLGVVYDPIDNFFFRVKPNNRQQKIVGYVGNIQEYRKPGGEVVPRASELIDAFDHLAPDLKRDVKIVIMGGGGGLAQLQQMAKGKSHVEVPGRVTEQHLKKTMACFDIGYMEAYNALGYKAMIGYKVQQYLAMGIPTITPMIGERVRWKRAILSIPALETDYSNYDDYVGKIAEMIGNGIGKRNMAGRRIAGEFRESTILNRFRSIYRKIYRVG